MIYKISEDLKKELLKKAQNRLLFFYGTFLLFVIYTLYTNWDFYDTTMRVIWFTTIIIIPFAFLYFKNNQLIGLTTTYRIEDGRLIVEDKNKLRYKILISNIRDLKEVPNGTIIEAKSLKILISNNIENSNLLITELKNKVANNELC